MFNFEHPLSGDTCKAIDVKYEDLKRCLMPIVENFNSQDVKIDVVLPLLEQAIQVTENNIVCETNRMYSETMNLVIHQLEWQYKTLMDMINKAGVPHPATSLTMDQVDKHKASRRQAIEATRQVPKLGGLDTVVGLTATKKMLHESVWLPLKFPHLFRGVLQTPTRILLYGPPGTGKTRLANAFAGELNAPFYNVTSTDLMSTWVGESEKLIRELFEHARETTTSCVIFIDEVDSICRMRTATEQELTRRMKTELLTQMEKCHDRMFLLCATNCPWDIDPAFLRRFHRRIYIPLPKRESRLEILQRHSRDMTLSLTNSEWHELIECTEGFSGCDLVMLANNALMEPLRDAANYGGQGTLRSDVRNHKVVPRNVTMADFKKAMQDTRCTVSPDDLLKFDNFTKMYGQMG